MDRSKQVGIAAVIFIGIILYIIFDYSKQYISPNILYFTQPISSFSGIIEKIDGNTITVTQPYSYLERGFELPTLYSTGGSRDKLLKTKNLSFQVDVLSTTHILRSQVSVPYLFNRSATSSSMSAQLSPRDLKRGERVEISGGFDLRTLKGSRLQANRVELASFINRINGTITQLSGSTLRIQSTQLDRNANQNEKEYVITVKSDTEISRLNNKPAQMSGQAVSEQSPEKLQIGDLKKGMQVSIYTDSDITVGNAFSALRIEPVAPTPTGVVTPLAPIAPLATQSAGMR